MNGLLEDSIKHVSVVIITCNRKKNLKVCLESVSAQDFPSIETVVVDNNSNDGTATMLRENFPWVKHIALEENIGIAARNKGFEAASGDLVVTLDDDSELPAPNVISRIVQKFRENEKMGAAGFRIINKFGEPEKWFDNLSNEKEDSLAEAHDGYLNTTINTCGSAIRPEMFERTGGFWEPYHIYVEEQDLATRIIGTGSEIRYFPTITIVHHRPAKNFHNARFHYYMARNNLWYIWRNFDLFTAIKKTIWHILSGGLKALYERKFIPWLNGAWDGMLGLSRAFKTRKPVKKQYLSRVEGRSSGSTE